MFSNQNKQMYDDLVTATIHTSADMSAKLVVVQDGTAVKVECNRSSLIVKRDEAGLLITLPLAKMERRQSMNGQLPGYLSELLHIYVGDAVFVRSGRKSRDKHDSEGQSYSRF